MASEWVELSRWAVSLIVPAISGLGGVWVGAKLSDRRETAKRRLDFVFKQLSELYAPLVSLRREISALSELRVRISATAGVVWKQLCEDQRPHGPDALKKLMDERSPAFTKIVDYENKQLREKLLPAYRQMAATMRDRMWLAEIETRSFYPQLIDFIEIWNRYVDESLPGEVLEALGHSEQKLHPFYDHIQQTHDKLRGILAAGGS